MQAATVQPETRGAQAGCCRVGFDNECLRLPNDEIGGCRQPKAGLRWNLTLASGDQYGHQEAHPSVNFVAQPGTHAPGQERHFARLAETCRSTIKPRRSHRRRRSRPSHSAVLGERPSRASTTVYAAIARSCFQSLTTVFATDSPLGARPSSTVINRSPSNAGLSSRHR